MKEGGFWLLGIGAAITLGSFLLGNTVETYSASAYVPERVVNLSKLQLQTMVFASGAVLFLAGAIFTAAGLIGEKLDTFRWAVPAPIAAELDTRPPAPATATEDPAELTAKAVRAEYHEAADREFGRVVTIVGVLAVAAIVIFGIIIGSQ